MRKSFLLAVILVSASYLCLAISFNRIIYPIVTKDDSGYGLRQSRSPQRIVSASPAVTEILFAFNINDRIVGVTQMCDHPKEAINIEKAGRDKLDINKLLKLKPDLVIVPVDDKKFNLDALRKLSFTEIVSTETSSMESRQMTLEVFAVNPKSLSDIMEYISTIGTITNREHAAYSLKQRMSRRMDWVEARARKEKRLKALLLVSKRPVTVAAEGSYLSDLLRVAGFENVAPKGRGMFPKMERKEIEKAGPDIVISATDVARKAKDLWGNRNFRKTNAGKNKKAICIDQELLFRPGPRIVQAVEEIAEYAYGWTTQETQEKSSNL